MIMAGYKSADKRGVLLINKLEKIDPEMKFFGIGGREMIKNKNFENFADLKNRLDKPFQQEKNFRTDPRFYPLVCSLQLNINNFKILKDLNKKNFLERFKSSKKGQDTDLLITVGNQLLSTRILEKISKVYNLEKKTIPFRIHYDRTKRLFNYDFHNHLDFFINTMPSVAFDLQEYDFPGVFIGKQVVFNAWKFLLGNSEKYRECVKGRMIYLQKEVNHLVMEELIFEQRQVFRNEMGIEESATVIFISPGNEKNEINKNMPVCLNAVAGFVNKFTKSGRLNKNNFHVVISLEKELTNDKYNEDFKKLGISCSFINGNENGMRYKAMAASDLGVSQDGDSILECAAFQLPTVILNNRNFFQNYVTLLYNTFDSEINLLKDGDVYPEMAGRFFPEKIIEFWQEWFIKPKTRFRLAIETNKRLFEFLPEPQNKQDLTIDSAIFTPFVEPEMVLEEFLKTKLKEVRDLKKQKGVYEEIQNKRLGLLGLSFE